MVDKEYTTLLETQMMTKEELPEDYQRSDEPDFDERI